MGKDGSSEFIVEETDCTLKLTVKYRELNITKLASRHLQDSIVKKFAPVNPLDLSSKRITDVLDNYRDAESTLELRVEGDYLYVVTNTYGRDVTSDIENIFNYANVFLVDDDFNNRMMKFLDSKFPNHFERVHAYRGLLEDYNSGILDGYVMSGEFCCPENAPESFYPSILMLTAYAFPALYKHYASDAKSEHVLGMFSDIKLSYESFMSAPTEAILADIAFNTRRKFFRKISPNLSVTELSLIEQISKIVSADDLEYALRTVDFSSKRPAVEAWYNNVNVLNNFSAAVRRRLITSMFKDAGNLIDDAFEMTDRYATDYSFFKGVSSIEELHDRAMTLIPEITDDRYLSRVPKNIALNQIIEVPETDLKLILLVNQKDFVQTGRELHTCIGSASYFEKSLRGESYCYQIFNGEKLVGALEMAPKNSALKIVQCTGFRNAELESKDVIFGALRRSLKQSFESSVMSI